MTRLATIDKDINEALLLDVLSIYSDAEDKLLTAVAKRVAKGITEEGWNEKKLENTQELQKEIEKILGSTSKLSKAKISKGIIDAYKQGFAGVGGPKGTHNTILDEIDIPMNLKMQVLATNNLLDNATFQVLREASDAYQQVMEHATTGLLAGVDTRIQASQKMLNEFASKGITSFVDKAGRNWDLSSYAEMCARTVSSHAALQGHIDRQVEVGEDLVKVSTIGTTCPICQRWQGVVLSISGNSPKYHSLDEAKAAGLFHPNCKHTLGMYIPELDDGTDHEGKVEPAPLDMTSESSQRNKLIEKQRANERQIRYWKKRKALAITPEEKAKCEQKIKAWQYKNLIHCEKNGLRRQYAREGVMTGKATGPMGSFIGGSLKEYEEVYKKAIGDDPKKVHKTLLKMDLTRYSYKGWLRSEIKSLDELDIDKAMMKDASRKDVTPTSLYKKYIGDSPASDYAEVSPYEKGTKEYKTGYAKWLKDEVEKIGTAYGIKPEYKYIHEDIPVEDTKLSATEIYKKYHDGEKPTDAYKKLGGEEGTGMKYGKWVETKKKELIRDGIEKKVPFDSEPLERTRSVIKLSSSVLEKAKKTVDDPIIKEYKKEIAKIKDPKKMSVEMRDISSKISSATGHDKELLEKKYEALKERDLDILREKVKTAKLGSGTGDVDFEMRWLKEHVLDSKTIPEDVKAHVKKKYDIWDERKRELEAIEAEKKRKAEEKAKEEARKKRIVADIKDTVDKHGYKNKELEMLKDTFKDDDPDASIKRKAIDDIIREREKEAEARRKAEEAAKLREQRAKERAERRSKGGYIPRDPGASVLDGLTDFYDGSSAKSKAKSMVKEIASELGLTEEEALKQVNDDLAAIVDECQFGARIKGSVLKLVLSDDPSTRGFKNLFEVGTGGGCTNKNSRANGENRVFGYDGAAAQWENSAKDRPFYGMMVPKYDEGSPDIVKYYKRGPGTWYGDGITLVFDKSIASNMSFTLGDSLDYAGRVVGCEVTEPEFRGAHHSFTEGYVDAKKSGLDADRTLMKIASDSDEYMELQYHGNDTKQSMVDYIEHVYLDGDWPGIEKLLTEKGIPFTII